MEARGHFSCPSLVCLLVMVLLGCCREGSSVEFHTVRSEHPLVVAVGGDAILPCSADPGTSASQGFSLEWITFSFNQRTTNRVHTFENGKDQNSRQIPSYRNRTALFYEELQNGNMSLRLSKVKVSDSGDYICVTSSASGQHNNIITLSVRAKGSKPEISSEFCEDGSCRLVCESSGWSPKPAIDWLDGRKRRLTSSMKSVKWKPEGFNVKQRLVVEKDGNSTYICRVHEKDHVQETAFHI